MTEESLPNSEESNIPSNDSPNDFVTLLLNQIDMVVALSEYPAEQILLAAKNIGQHLMQFNDMRHELTRRRLLQQAELINELKAKDIDENWIDRMVFPEDDDVDMAALIEKISPMLPGILQSLLPSACACGPAAVDLSAGWDMAATDIVAGQDLGDFKRGYSIPFLRNKNDTVERLQAYVCYACGLPTEDWYSIIVQDADGNIIDRSTAFSDIDPDRYPLSVHVVPA